MVRIEHLTRRLNGRRVIDDLSLHIRRGEKVCLFGPSGAGKSTLVALLAGLSRNFEGTAAVNARRRAVVFQEPGLFWYKTLEENMLYPLKLGKIPIDRTVRGQYAGWLSAAGLKGFAGHYPHQVSGGMKQQAAVIRAFLPGPDFILLDEPFKSVDAAAKRRMIAHLRRTCPDVTLLLITHSIDEIPLIAERLLVFSEKCLSVYREMAISPQTSLDQLAAQIFGAAHQLAAPAGG